jgi:hypothetical protein
MLSGAIRLNHLWAMLLFAALVSLGLASLGRRTARGRIRYALWTLALFLLVAIGVAWLMYPLSR